MYKHPASQNPSLPQTLILAPVICLKVIVPNCTRVLCNKFISKSSSETWYHSSFYGLQGVWGGSRKQESAWPLPSLLRPYCLSPTWTKYPHAQIIILLVFLPTNNSMHNNNSCMTVHIHQLVCPSTGSCRTPVTHDILNEVNKATKRKIQRNHMNLSRKAECRKTKRQQKRKLVIFRKWIASCQTLAQSLSVIFLNFWNKGSISGNGLQGPRGLFFSPNALCCSFCFPYYTVGASVQF